LAKPIADKNLPYRIVANLRYFPFLMLDSNARLN